ncbi:YqcI/YcgG family protein [Erwinia piriflorinigrans]|uniref:YqcI/YcgG family protein n=1 Tax=Erwinia piriflorinigrans CFBP 5888 TaxID=1161919 RepID=V5Z727_9GAMM|nr:YqcI/YcgG family protein [Erwinia piriflorinigrans]CCG87043.1 putative protein yqcI [Erwinia piriflorinigrans CFBP 5888]
MDNGLVSCGCILRQPDLDKPIAESDIASSAVGWQQDAFLDISNRLNDRHFPCLFARHAWKTESLLFSFIRSKATLTDMMNAMTAFIQRTQNTAEKDRLYSPLLMVFEQQGFSTLNEAHQFAWQRLQALHDHDIQPWPEHIPTSPDDSTWSFCFGGLELFINISCPGHLQLKSRHLGKRVVFVVNPRVHFDILASHCDPKGIKIREKIRTRVCNYNNGYVPAALGFYGDENNLEWQQYQLNEPGAANFSRCPLQINKEINKT